LGVMLPHISRVDAYVHAQSKLTIMMDIIKHIMDIDNIFVLVIFDIRNN